MIRLTHVALGIALALVATAVPAPAVGAGKCPSITQKDGKAAPPHTLFKAARCNEVAGRIKTAVDQYAAFLKALRKVDAAARDRLADRTATAKERLTALRTRVPLLTVELPGDPSDYEVRIDGKDAPVEGLKYARPVDPGDHLIEVEMPDGNVHRFDEYFAEGDSRVVRVPTEGGSESADEVTDEPDEEPDSEDSEDSADDGDGIPMRTWAYVAGGVGAAGILIGAITGGMALGTKSTMDDNCDGEACNHEGKVAADEVQGLALGSTIGFTIGFAGLGAGALLWFLFPEEEEGEVEEQDVGVSLSPWMNESMLGIRGTW
ncbi:MAG: hypothetical protein JRI68_03495 [Deltaproteobacteria bacterium]|nr:hypothetical protein [Deltaproteobacteria bacterium]